MCISPNPLRPLASASSLKAKNYISVKKELNLISNFNLENATQSLVETKIKTMTLKQKVGQLFIFGFIGTNLNRNLNSLLTDYTPGAVIVFKRNIKSIKKISKLNY